MKVYRYNERLEDDTDVTIDITEKQILEVYWPWWLNQMHKKYGKNIGYYQELVTEENCIEDWVTSNWAWDVTDEYKEK